MSSYTESAGYETFIRRAFKVGHEDKHGASQSYMQNLIDSENGKSNVSQLGSTNKLFSEVQKNLIKCSKKFLSLKLTDQEKADFQVIIDKIESSSSSKQLRALIDEGISITQRFK